jgi:hypothetical protein
MGTPETFAVRCPSCDLAVPAEAAGSYDVGDDAGETTQHLLLKCKECASPFLVRRYGYYVGGGMGWEYNPVTVLCPGERSLDASVPKIIAKSYEEAVACAGSGAFTACAIMCRRTLEGICDSHGIVAGNLDGKLKKLRDDGVIEKRLFEWADSLRLVGNEAAHDVAAEVPKEDARDLLDFTRALVEYIFTFTENFKKFTERRAARRAAIE